jgi:hypothetical protein
MRPRVCRGIVETGEQLAMLLVRKLPAPFLFFAAYVQQDVAACCRDVFSLARAATSGVETLPPGSMSIPAAADRPPQEGARMTGLR